MWKNRKKHTFRAVKFRKFFNTACCHKILTLIRHISWATFKKHGLLNEFKVEHTTLVIQTLNEMFSSGDHNEALSTACLNDCISKKCHNFGIVDLLPSIKGNSSNFSIFDNSSKHRKLLTFRSYSVAAVRILYAIPYLCLLCNLRVMIKRHVVLPTRQLSRLRLSRRYNFLKFYTTWR